MIQNEVKNTNVVLKTSGLSKHYGSKKSLDNVSITINQGDIYGLIGKNGAGKTTFMKTCLGMVQATSGTCQILGSNDPKNLRKVGALIETPSIYGGLSAKKNLKIFSKIYGGTDADINRILNLVGLGNVGNRKAQKFSLGMRQRLGIAIALLGNPKLLILDEPINGLDPAGIKEIRDLIIYLNKEEGVTFLISSHLLDELGKIATKYGFINDGQLLEEVTANELRDLCEKKIIIGTKDNQKAYNLLCQYVNSNDITFTNNNVEIKNNDDKICQYNKILVENGIAVNKLYNRSQSLEEYFIEKVG
ncbi:ATP-binding cassette domain-containing protein [Lachnobacterium bovis]|jgi:ABC-2 type transport system ATP-binding protein|uniref:ABC-2 type transport system ATP-binding protein n=1 Tax=Lachnobacterium bovis TaxID=140626 RepID=A0A1H9U430_9FIRM|nr:ATP-binding cassette domain-containing protein [Lachnobacterium bovis]SES03988.1 ABC-2 type transport system ATP-binding protein [Lachnobacterium bovis]